MKYDVNGGYATKVSNFSDDGNTCVLVCYWSEVHNFAAATPFWHVFLVHSWDSCLLSSFDASVHICKKNLFSVELGLRGRTSFLIKK